MEKKFNLFGKILNDRFNTFSCLLYASLFILIIISARKASLYEVLLWTGIWIITLMSMIVTKEKDTNIVLIVSLFLWCFLGIVQPIWSLWYPHRVRTYFITKDMLLDGRLRSHHIFDLSVYFCVFCCAIVLAYWLAQYVCIRSRFPYEKRENKVNLIALAVIFAVIDTLLQYILGLGNGYAKFHFSIPHAAILIYLERIVRLICWTYILESVFESLSYVLKKKVIYGIILTFILSVPGIVLGQHKSLVLGFAQFAFLVVIILGKSFSKKDIKKMLMAIAIIILFALAALYIMLLITELIRIGDAALKNGIDLVYIIFNRITGISDGIKVVDYVAKGGETLSFSNYLGQVLKKDSAYPISYFYVDVVLGASRDVVGGVARPAYASGLLYGGLEYSVLFAFISGISCGLFDRLAVLYSKNWKTTYVSIIMVYLVVHVFWTTVIEGNVDDISTYLFVAVIAWIFMFFTRIRFDYVEKNI